MAPWNRRPATERGSATAPMVGTSEEVLVSIPGAMVHLIDDQECPFLSSGDFSVVRVNQQGNGIVAFVRVGQQLRWPLTKDEPAVKLDSTHYFFTIRVPRPVDEMDSETAGQVSLDNILYVMSVWVLVLAIGCAYIRWQSPMVCQCNWFHMEEAKRHLEASLNPHMDSRVCSEQDQTCLPSRLATAAF